MTYVNQLVLCQARQIRLARNDVDNRDRIYCCSFLIHVYVASAILVYVACNNIAVESKVVSRPLLYISSTTVRTRQGPWNSLVTQAFGLQCSSEDP